MQLGHTIYRDPKQELRRRAPTAWRWVSDRTLELDYACRVNFTMARIHR